MDIDDGKEATPCNVLREQIMDSRIPKNEREWWAKREIESQQARIEALEAWKRRAMVLLNDATYHDGRYDQHTSREWQKEACALLREEE